MDDLLETLEKAHAAAGPLAIMILVVAGGLVAKRTVWTWTWVARWPPTATLQRVGRESMGWHAPFAGALLGAVSGLLEGPLVQRAAWGLVLGMAAPFIYDKYLHPAPGGSPTRFTPPPPAPPIVVLQAPPPAPDRDPPEAA